MNSVKRAGRWRGPVAACLTLTGSLALLGGCGGGGGSSFPRGERTVYESGFEGSVGAGWSVARTSVTPVGSRRFLGEFGSDEGTRLSLTGLPAHTRLRIRFDLYILRTWDGNDATYGPDVWRLSCDGVTVLNATFSNWDGGIAVVPQTYPGPHPGATSPARTGAAENNVLGYPLTSIYPASSMDSIYRLEFTVAHTAATANLDFTGLGNYGGGFADESWGLDNVQVVAVP